MVVVKYTMSVVLGVCVTLLLLYIMQSLIQSGEKVLKEDASDYLVEYVRVKEAQQLAVRERKPKQPPPPDEPPPAIPRESFQTPIEAGGWSVNGLVVAQMERPSGPGLSFTDGDYLPIVQVQPVYPRMALARGLIGWVIIEFTVTETGAVSDPFIVDNCAVVQQNVNEVECEGKPNSIFDTAALRAALKFKFKPKVIDGVAMATAGVRNKITFELRD
jgi:protein TonB